MTPHLAHPEWAAPAGVALVLLAAGVIASWAHARRRAQRLLGARSWVPHARLVRDLAVFAALGAVSLALLGPFAGTRVVRVDGAGIDLVLLLDVSRSMDATDVPPSRLTRARALAAELLARLGPEDRAALAAYSGRGVLLTPLSPDHAALAELVPALDSELIAPNGSDLASGISAAVEAFEAASERPRVVVALADGEDPDGRSETGSDAARRAAVRVVTVGIGSDAGGPIPDRGGALRDAFGDTVRSRRDLERLAALATATDGAAFAGNRFGDVDLGALIDAIRRDAGQAGAAIVERRVPAKRVAPLAALAFALLVAEWIGLPALRPQSRRRAAGVLARATLALAACTPVALAAGAGDEAIRRLEAALRERPGDSQLLVALGVARAQAGLEAEAAHALRGAALAARDADDAALAYYDLGVLALEREELAAARDAFLDALALAPEDARARFNLEWTLRALAAEPPPGEPRGDEDAADSGERPEPEESEVAAPPGSSADREEAGSGSGPDAPAPGSAAALELSPERVERWLEGVTDDPGRALRAAAREGDPGDTGRDGRRPW